MVLRTRDTRIEWVDGCTEDRGDDGSDDEGSAHCELRAGGGRKM